MPNHPKPIEDRPPDADAGNVPAVTATPKVALRMGVAPTNVEEAWRLSNFLAASDLVPKGYKGKPADILVGIQYGMELGFAPMQALQSIAVIGGRPAVWGDGFLALIISERALYQDHDEHFEVQGEPRETLTADDLKRDDTAAVCTFWRRGKARPVTRRFSVGDAKKAQLWGKEGPWQTYPARQLQMRARGFAGRDAFPDLLRGLKTDVEVLDTPSEGVDVQPEPIDTTPMKPRRASAVRATPPADAPSTIAPDAPPDTPNQPPTPDDGVTEILRGLTVLHTGWVVSQSEQASYYEITLKSTTGKEQRFRTTDEKLYQECASFEGTDHQLVIGYHVGEPNAGSQTIRILDRISIYEPSRQGGDLFQK